jgi:hypothetical protein
LHCRELNLSFIVFVRRLIPTGNVAGLGCVEVIQMERPPQSCNSGAAGAILQPILLRIGQDRARHARFANQACNDLFGRYGDSATSVGVSQQAKPVD